MVGVVEGVKSKQGRIHDYLSRVRLGRGSNKSLQASKQQNTTMAKSIESPTKANISVKIQSILKNMISLGSS